MAVPYLSLCLTICQCTRTESKTRWGEFLCVGARVCVDKRAAAMSTPYHVFEQIHIQVCSTKQVGVM
jgi:hypothetical protein